MLQDNSKIRCLVLFSVVTLFSIILSYIQRIGLSPIQNDQKQSKKQIVDFRKFEATVPYQSQYMKFFLSWPLSIREVVFYEFDTSRTVTKIAVTTKAEHELECASINVLRSKQDELVKAKGDELFAFNILASNRAGSIRSLPDTRHKLCPSLDMTTNDEAMLGQVSVIICYYNEAPSALLRTINSVIYRSPSRLLKEIIIVDDFSEPEYDAKLIEKFIFKTNANITIVRTTRREGLIRARLFGANLASAKVLIFLDSHVEANIGWLEPLVSQIQADHHTIACPMIDLINSETLIYSASPMVRGGLNWKLNFKWDSVPSEDLKSAEDFIKPIDSATMAGGLYAIDREYFYQLGSYDSQMDLWGGENIEMSLRIWMCGGRIKILPCSRLGHIFRKTRPYGPKPEQPDSLLVNSHRSARVWLGDYIQHFYAHYPHAKLFDDDVSEREALRDSLDCKNFTWFIDNVYPRLKDEPQTDISGEETTLDDRPNLFKRNVHNRIREQ